MNNVTKRNILFGIGASFVILSSVIVAFFTMLVFSLRGLPVLSFFVGVILLWRSGKTILVKTLWTLLPLLFMLTYFVSLHWLNTNEAEIFLIPTSYRGRVRIYFNEKCGQAPHYENGRRVFRIPENGVLLTKFEQEHGYIGKQHFFFVDSLGRRRAIQKMNAEKLKQADENGKSINGDTAKKVGVFYSGWAGSGNYNDTHGYSFEEFFISTYPELINTFGLQYESQRDSLDHFIILDCRNNMVR